MKLKNLERLFIKKWRAVCKRKVSGDVSFYIIGMFIALFLAVILRVNFDKQRVYVTYDTVDDTIVSALVGAATYNQMEFALGGQRVIFRDITEIEAEEPLLPGQTPPPVLSGTEEQELALQRANDYLMDSELLTVYGDSKLQQSYDNFMNNLKKNLKLNGAMESSMSGIVGSVLVNEFSIYNKFEQFDEDGNLLGFRYIKYMCSGGVWSVYPYNIGIVPTVYNSYDKTFTSLQNTTVTANITLNIRTGDYNAVLMPGLTEADMVQTVHYQRLVDIRE